MADAPPAGDDAADVPDDAWGVARLNDELGAAIEEAGSRFPAHVVGEVSDVSAYDYASFFTLCDVDDDHTIDCIAWSSAREGFAADLEAGTKCVVRADVEFYEPGGDCQLNVRDYWPLGESPRKRRREALRTELADAGLLDDGRKRPLPAFPDCVGVVTSLSGSAREDVSTAVQDRSPRTDVKIHGATVQGDDAVGSMVSALAALEADPDVETILLTRGGGADDTLWVFDAEPLVYAIADCGTPVVVAVGHEDDRTLAEAVADRRAMTPTDAGVAAAPDLAAVRDDVGSLGERVRAAYDSLVETRLERIETRLDGAMESLSATVRQRRLRRRATVQRAADLEGRIDHAYRGLVGGRLDGIEARVDEGVREVRRATETEAAAAARIADLEARIDTAYDRTVQRRLEGLSARIDAAADGYEARREARKRAAEARRLRVAVAGLLVVLLAVVAFALL